MADEFDPRLTPARPEIAARHLEEQVRADRFVEGQLHEIIAAQAPLREAAAPDALLSTEVLKGERVTIYETTDEGWAWGQLEADGYVGWLPMGALAPLGPSPTHKVAVPQTLVFPGPSIRLPPIETLSFGARVVVDRIEGALAVTASRAYVPAQHLVPIESAATDFVVVAEMFLHVPYLWGGKTGAGIDCSGLVQVAVTACAIACPRDSDMQETSLGQPVPSFLADLRRGDLVFWKGHVAIARDPSTLIHANAFHMAVAIEPLRDAVERIRAAGSEVTSVRRIIREA
jgi:cell wall-associated NlpC family hydrolase